MAAVVVVVVAAPAARAERVVHTGGTTPIASAGAGALIPGFRSALIPGFRSAGEVLEALPPLFATARDEASASCKEGPGSGGGAEHSDVPT